MSSSPGGHISEPLQLWRMTSNVTLHEIEPVKKRVPNSARNSASIPCLPKGACAELSPKSDVIPTGSAHVAGHALQASLQSRFPALVATDLLCGLRPLRHVLMMGTRRIAHTKLVVLPSLSQAGPHQYHVFPCVCSVSESIGRCRSLYSSCQVPDSVRLDAHN